MVITEYNEENYRNIIRRDARNDTVVDIIDTIMNNTGKDLQYACSIAGVSLEEYQLAKGDRRGNN